MIIVANDKGMVELHHTDNPNKFMLVQSHDVASGGVTSVKMTNDEHFLLTSGVDGLMFIHQIDKNNLKIESTWEPLADVEGVDFTAQD